VVLQAAAGITFLAYLLSSPHDMGSLQLTIAILGVVVLNAAIGFGQEYSAERSADALRAMVPHLCRVIRDGERTEVPVSDVVPGDVVLLEAGDAVPADATVVEAHDLTVNMAALTGESEPVAVDRVHMGTTVTSGSGKAVVVATGAGTEFGRICQLTQDAPESRTPLQLQVASMARRVSAVALSVGAAMFVIRAPSGATLVASFVFALGVMVALVPEGLPATLSVSLAIGVRRMARRRALVKRLLAVEALGSTTVICTDKTGTLTKAEMTVTEIWVAGTSHAVSGVGYAPVGQVTGRSSAVDPLRAAATPPSSRARDPASGPGRDAQTHHRVGSQHGSTRGGDRDSPQ